MAGLEPGVRCVRGPDWQWEDQDGGPGHVGTVVFLGHSGHPGCLPGTVMVVWDNGTVQNYRAGYSNAYDLRVLDTAPCGYFHSGVKCDGCGKNGIFGIRWSCRVCTNIDLCSRCYNLKFHDVTHEFTRRLAPDQPAVPVPCRTASGQSEIFGAFRGSLVVRGKDWDWDDQDGGPGNQGLVEDITNWKEQTGNSVVCVVWHGSKVNRYRLGHNAKVDVRYIRPASGGKVYTSHLPLLGKPLNSVTTFLIGQTVEVSVDLNTLKKMQIGHGEFRDEMALIVGRRGKVHRITEKGDVRVNFFPNTPASCKWTVNPMALRIIQGFHVGDEVTITSDKSLIEKYHQNYAALDGFAGRKGTITHIHSEASMVVDFGGGRVGAVHSGIILQPRQQDECHNVNSRLVSAACAGDAAEVDRLLMGAAGPASQFTIIPDNEAILTGLHKAAGKGLLNVVVALVKFRPTLINQKLQDKTVIMIAAYEGNLNLVNWLLVNGADGSIPDSAGDLPIHYAAIGSQPMAILSLVDKGSPVNTQNKENRTPLHLSVINRNEETVRALLKAGASTNIQDSNLETPLHIAINTGSEEIASLLIPHSNLLICDGSGFNPLHLAVKSGNVSMVASLLQEDRRSVNIVTRDGLAPLHLAANGSLLVVNTLLDTPECDVNIQDGNGRTALHYAAQNSNLPLIFQLIKYRINTDVQDCEGNTAAHLSISSSPAVVESPYINELEEILNPSHLDRLRALNLSPGRILQVGVLLELLRHGDPGLRNCNGETSLDLLESGDLKRFVEELTARTDPTSSEHEYEEIVDELTDRVASWTVGQEECRVCSEPSSLVTFQPCKHRTVCEQCSARMKKCLVCQVPIAQKILEPVSAGTSGDGRLRSLEQKVLDLEEQFLCGICMERKRNVAFLCGHGACTHCTQDLVTCHMCRKKIEKKIPLY